MLIERQMDVRTDEQTHVGRGPITLDEFLFCNIIKNVKHEKTESKNELQELHIEGIPQRLTFK